MSKTAPEWDSTATAANKGKPKEKKGWFLGNKGELEKEEEEEEDEDMDIGDEEQQGLLQQEGGKKKKGNPAKKQRRKETKGSMLNCCLVLIGISCLLVIALVLTLFLLLVEPCLNPATTSKNYITIFDSPIQIIQIHAVVEKSLVLNTLPVGTETNRLDTTVDLSATTQSDLQQTEVHLVTGTEAYDLSFTRPEVFWTLESCSTEDVVMALSPSFSVPLNASFQVSKGFIETKALVSVQFASFIATLEDGPITMGVVTCNDTVNISTQNGNIKTSATNALRFYASTALGSITLNTPTAGDYNIYSGGGMISVTSMGLTGDADQCHLFVITEKGEIDIALIDILTSNSCSVRLTSGSGSISVAIKGFSGSFQVSTIKGKVDIPGFSYCDGTTECLGDVNSNGAMTHHIEISTELGDIQLVFV